MKSGGNRYSVFCARSGCLQSRATGLREARGVLRRHEVACGCRAEHTITHWHVNDEAKRAPPPPRVVT